MSEDTGSGIKFGDLKKMIGDTVAEVVGSLDLNDKRSDAKDSRSEGRPEGRVDVGAMVSREIAKLREKEAAEEKAKTLDSDIASLKERTKEKAPVERRRVHKFMGWGEND